MEITPLATFMTRRKMSHPQGDLSQYGHPDRGDDGSGDNTSGVRKVAGITVHPEIENCALQKQSCKILLQ